jgi:hypothetical protein
MLKNQHPNAMSIETDNNKTFIKNKLKSLMQRKPWRNAAIHALSAVEMQDSC